MADCLCRWCVDRRAGKTSEPASLNDDYPQLYGFTNPDDLQTVSVSAVDDYAEIAKRMRK